MNLSLKQLSLVALLLLVVIGFLFRNAFHPNYTVFSNDGPLGSLQSQQFQTFGHIWSDSNWLGSNHPAWSNSGVTGGFRVMSGFRVIELGFCVVCIFLGFWKNFTVAFVCAWLGLILFGLSLAATHFVTGIDDYLGMSFGTLCLAFIAGFFLLPIPSDQTQ